MDSNGFFIHSMRIIYPFKWDFQGFSRIFKDFQGFLAILINSYGFFVHLNRISEDSCGFFIHSDGILEES